MRVFADEKERDEEEEGRRRCSFDANAIATLNSFNWIFTEELQPFKASCLILFPKAIKIHFIGAKAMNWRNLRYSCSFVRLSARPKQPNERKRKIYINRRTGKKRKKTKENTANGTSYVDARVCTDKIIFTPYAQCKQTFNLLIKWLRSIDRCEKNFCKL